MQDSHKDAEVIIFDLDGTLAASKQSITEEMGSLICKLLAIRKVAVVSGGPYTQFKNQLLDKLVCGHQQFKNLFLFPTNGSMFYEYENDEWVEKYEETLSADQKKNIFTALQEAIKQVFGTLTVPNPEYGNIIEDREGQVTFSGQGQRAPLEVKSIWDTDRSKRSRMLQIIKPLLGDEYNVSIGGTTSIDITKRGVNKAYALRKIEKVLNVPISKMLFVGDSIFEGGNDYQALETGVAYVKVGSPADTAVVISQIIE